MTDHEGSRTAGPDRWGSAEQEEIHDRTGSWLAEQGLGAALTPQVLSTLSHLEPVLLAEMTSLAAAGVDAWFGAPGGVLGQSVAQRLRSVEMTIDGHLAAIAPERALDGRALAGLGDKASVAVLGETGFDRFGWIIAVAGGGSDRSLRRLHDYVVEVARWVVLMECTAVLRRPDRDVLPGVHLNEGAEQHRRYSTTEVRYSWVSELLLDVVADVVARTPELSGLGHVNRDAVEDLYEALQAFYDHPEGGALGWSSAIVSSGASLLAGQLALLPGTLAGHGFRDLVLSLDVERKPFVVFDGLPVPVALREAALGLEQAVSEHARDVLGDKGRADLFESVISAVLDEVLPTGAVTVAGPLSIRGSRSDDPGETDFALVLSGEPAHVVVGEAKASFPPEPPGAVLNAYGETLGKAVKQVAARIDRLRGGAKLTGADGQTRLRGEDTATGLVVTLHAYATALLDQEVLGLVSADRADVAVMPLHQLVLVMRCLGSPAEIFDYLDFRAQLLDAGMKALDEVDVLVTHLSGEGEECLQHARSAQALGRPAVLPGYQVSSAPAVCRSRPLSAQEWAQQLRSDCSSAD